MLLLMHPFVWCCRNIHLAEGIPHFKMIPVISNFLDGGSEMTLAAISIEKSSHLKESLVLR